MFIYCLSILFGAVSAIILGKFIGVSFAGIYSLLIVAFAGAAIGGISAPKINAIDTSGRNTRGILAACFSLWFGITAGLIVGAILAQITILPLFVYNFGNPDTTPWPGTAANTFLILAVAMAIAGGLGMGVWFFNNTLKSRFQRTEPVLRAGGNTSQAPVACPEQVASTTDDERRPG